MTARNALGFTALAFAAAASWYLTVSLREPVLEPAPVTAASQAYYLKSARVLGTDSDGDLLYEIEAEYAEQRPDQQIEFQNVHINYTPDAGVPWTLNADSAVIGRNQERVILSGHVLAVSSEGFAGEVTEIRTSWLEFDPMTYRAETDRRVQIRVGARSLTATGMLASLQENQLQLKSNVSGKFFP
ncbi:MAG: LPS export ABC transporter periplasmic protein LptC [Woeseia sp.]